MRRLADGHYAIILNSSVASSVRLLGSKAQAPVSGDQIAALSRLCHGVDDDEQADELFTLLSVAGVTTENAPWIDPVIEEQLRVLGEGFSWFIDWDPRARDLAALIRRAHARRKVFFPEFGQTPVIPEIAAFRCLELARGLKSGARVIHIGDDDMLSLGMAALGFRPFVVDIDPLLLSFLSRVAREEGVVIEMRQQDLLAPFPDELCGAFDAALSDPMSFENCQLVFLSRAVSALKQGGLLFTTVHPLAREVCERVYHRLPVKRLRSFASKNVYYWLKFDESPYRSDLVVLERTSGDPPWLPSDTIPFEHIVDGELTERNHGALEVRGLRSKARGPVSKDELARALTSGLEVPILGTHTFEDERFTHALAWFDGGQAAVSYDQLRGWASLSFYPFEESRSYALYDAMAALLRPLGKQAFMMPAFKMPPLPLSRAKGE